MSSFSIHYFRYSPFPRLSQRNEVGPKGQHLYFLSCCMWSIRCGDRSETKISTKCGTTILQVFQYHRANDKAVYEDNQPVDRKLQRGDQRSGSPGQDLGSRSGTLTWTARTNSQVQFPLQRWCVCLACKALIWHAEAPSNMLHTNAFVFVEISPAISVFFSYPISCWLTAVLSGPRNVGRLWVRNSMSRCFVRCWFHAHWVGRQNPHYDVSCLGCTNFAPCSAPTRTW